MEKKKKRQNVGPTRGDVVFDSLHRHGGVGDRVPLLVLHDAPDPAVHLVGGKREWRWRRSFTQYPAALLSCARFSATDLLHEGQHGLSVLLPLVRQLALVRELITAQEDGQLQTVGVQVAEVVHA